MGLGGIGEQLQEGEDEEGTGEVLWAAVVGEGEGNIPRETLEQLQGTGRDRGEGEEQAVGGTRGKGGNNSKGLVRGGTASRGIWGRFRGT